MSEDHTNRNAIDNLQKQLDSILEQQEALVRSILALQKDIEKHKANAAVDVSKEILTSPIEEVIQTLPTKPIAITPILEKATESLQEKITDSISQDHSTHVELPQEIFPTEEVLEVPPVVVADEKEPVKVKDSAKVNSEEVESSQKVAEKIQSFIDEGQEIHRTRSMNTPPSFDARVQDSSGSQKFSQLIQNFFTQGNLIVRIGIVIFFLGVSFLAAYTASKGYFPIQVRLAGIGAIAASLIGVGWKTRTKHNGFGKALQGGGIATLYLVIYSSAMIYHVVSPAIALNAMLSTVVLGVWLAILQKEEFLAVMATAGGFLVPILTSSNSNNFIGLFTFYLFLNIGVIAIAWFQAWRLLNWVGFVFTFVISGIWALWSYTPQDYLVVQLFFAAYYGLYLAITVLFALKQPPNLKGFIDGSLTFGMPIAAFGLQACIVYSKEYGLAYSSLILAITYISLALSLWKKYQQTLRLLIEAFIVLAVMFGTLTIPFAFNAAWTSASWALEAVGLVWVGLRQARIRPRVVGCLLYVAAMLSLLKNGYLTTGDTPIVTGDCLNLILLSLSAFCISYVYDQYPPKKTEIALPLSGFFLWVGWVLWLFAGWQEIEAHIKLPTALTATIFFVVTSSALFMGLSRILHWKKLCNLTYSMLPLFFFWSLQLFALLCISHNFSIDVSLERDLFHPTFSGAFYVYIFFFVVQYFFLHQSDARSMTIKSYHIATAWFFYALIVWDVIWWIYQASLSTTMILVIWFICSSVVLILHLLTVDRKVWPFKTHPILYKNEIPLPIIGSLLIWFFAEMRVLETKLLYWIPGTNLFDLMLLGGVGLMFWVSQKEYGGRYQIKPRKMWLAVSYGLFFLWLNVILLRGLCVVNHVPYCLSDMLREGTIQTAVSILWSLCALIIMKIAQKEGDRQIWKVGAALLGAVVVKLFTQDLAGHGTLARVFSFMGVGLLMLLIGYLSPIPPKKETKNTSDL